MLGIALLLLVIIIFVVIRFAEQKMIFFPTVFPGGYWDTSSFPGQIEDCSFRAEDGVVLRLVCSCRQFGYRAPAHTAIFPWQRRGYYASPDQYGLSHRARA